MNADEEKLREYRDALIKLDELSLELGRTLAYLRIGWDEVHGESSAVLGSINQIAGRIGAAMPQDIKQTRPSPLEAQAFHE